MQWNGAELGADCSLRRTFGFSFVTSKLKPLRFLPIFFVFALALFSRLLTFNGLYGQDAFEYLRQCRGFFERLQGQAGPLPSVGSAEFASGYPFLGALVQTILKDAALSLQIVSWLAAGAGLWMFVQLLGTLAPGTRAESRWVFAFVTLALCPLFFRAGMTCMSDALGLLLALSAFYFGLRALEAPRVSLIAGFALMAGFAIITRYALAALIVPLALVLWYNLFERKRWLSLFLIPLLAMLAALLHFWLKPEGAGNPLAHSMFQHWSAHNFLRNSFLNENGLSQYVLPNALFLLFPLAHPAFCLFLPGLFFLFKKTDLSLPAKKILLACIVSYLILLGGIPHQNLRHLLPAYALLLLVLYPAWDRFFCYGLIFFRRLTIGIVAAALVVQIAVAAILIRPVLQRNRLETSVAREMARQLPPNATVFAFDLDVALQQYLPEMNFRSLWAQRFDAFPENSFVLFNENLRLQWDGQNPVLNWDFLQANYHLGIKSEFPGGWKLWEIQKPRQ